MTYVTYPPDLVDSVKAGDLIPFIGAGLSIPSGGPSWFALADQMIGELGLEIGFEHLLKEISTTLHGVPGIRTGLLNDLRAFMIGSLDPLMIAQLYETNFGRQRMIRLLRDSCNMITNPTRTHDMLVSFGCKVFITTNYDDLIERAIASAGERWQSLVREEDIAYWTTGERRVIKMHGSLISPFDANSIVFSRSDYEAYALKHPNMDMLVQFLMSTGTLLLIGYSVRDPSFLAIYDRVRFLLQRNKRQAYFVTFDLPKAVQDYWAEYNLYPINLDGTNKELALYTWLSGLK